jgi:hypothetical protein
MTAIQALRNEVKQYVDKADDKALRMVKAIVEIKQEGNESNEQRKSRRPSQEIAAGNKARQTN